MLGEHISVVTSDVEAAVEEEFNLWYNEQHLSDVLACPGWLSATRYRALDEEPNEPRYLAIYEMETPDAMWTPELQAIKGFGDFWLNLRSMWWRQYRRIYAATPSG